MRRIFFHPRLPFNVHLFFEMSFNRATSRTSSSIMGKSAKSINPNPSSHLIAISHVSYRRLLIGSTLHRSKSSFTSIFRFTVSFPTSPQTNPNLPHRRLITVVLSACDTRPKYCTILRSHRIYPHAFWHGERSIRSDTTCNVANKSHPHLPSSAPFDVHMAARFCQAVRTVACASDNRFLDIPVPPCESLRLKLQARENF